jgi:hypothetical protein
MKDYFQKLDIIYQLELLEIVKTKSDSVNRKALDLSQDYYLKLKEFVKQNQFNCETEEINYFKNIKPKVHSQIIYFRKIIQINSNLPIGSIETKKQYYTTHLLAMTAFYEENKEIILYYRSFKTNLDGNFFIRKNAFLHRNLEFEFIEVDYDQCTGYDLIIAKLLALEKLEKYVCFQLLHVDSIDQLTFLPESKDFSIPAFISELQWTDSKIALVELLVVLKETGVFSNGTVDMKTIVSHFEYFFQINLGDHYKSANEIKGRKNSKTKFLDLIIENFKRKLYKEDSY